MYFHHPYASNSDLKELRRRHEGRDKLDNIEAIYDFGTQFHSGILEPHKFDGSGLTAEKIELTKCMSKTFWKDEMCRNIAMAPDFKREHEFYRSNRFGITARCKTDGISKKLGVILELKGLSVTTEKSFLESIEHLHYDQGAAWYLNVTTSEAAWIRYKLFAGISKIYPDRMFKVLVDREHKIYKSGMVKVKQDVNLWKNVYGFK